MIPIEKKSYDMESPGNNKNPRNPLMIGCSGGSGHIIAINGISDYFNERKYIK